MEVGRFPYLEQIPDCHKSSLKSKSGYGCPEGSAITIKQSALYGLPAEEGPISSRILYSLIARRRGVGVKYNM